MVEQYVHDDPRLLRQAGDRVEQGGVQAGPAGFEEATRYISGPPGLVDDLQWVAIGLLIVIFPWFRPQGVLPERRRRIGAAAPPKPIEIPNEDVVTLAGSLRAPGLADATRQDGSAVSRAGRPIARSVPSSVEPDAGVVFSRLGQMLTRKAGRLSGGERKMLAMGRVLMIQPAVREAR